MPFEDKTLNCVQCSQEFVFSAGEQQFFEERNLNSPPKRCKPCRLANKQKKHSRKDAGQGYGAYRSPAFENSAPRHQKIRGQQNARGKGDYRSPGFKEYENIKPDEEYRSPAFREYAGINAEEEYRAPGFKEYEGIKPDEEYRSPGFMEMKEQWKDDKPTFSIVCSVCEKQAMVPFLPEEKENPMCPECYKAHRAKRKEEYEQKEQEAKALAETEAQENLTDAENTPAPESEVSNSDSTEETDSEPTSPTEE